MKTKQSVLAARLNRRATNDVLNAQSEAKRRAAELRLLIAAAPKQEFVWSRAKVGAFIIETRLTFDETRSISVYARVYKLGMIARP